jgi:hypothetical protein
MQREGAFFIEDQEIAAKDEQKIPNEVNNFIDSVPAASLRSFGGDRANR